MNGWMRGQRKRPLGTLEWTCLVTALMQTVRDPMGEVHDGAGGQRLTPISDPPPPGSSREISGLGAPL